MLNFTVDFSKVDDLNNLMKKLEEYRMQIAEQDYYEKSLVFEFNTKVKKSLLIYKDFELIETITDFADDINEMYNNEINKFFNDHDNNWLLNLIYGDDNDIPESISGVFSPINELIQWKMIIKPQFSKQSTFDKANESFNQFIAGNNKQFANIDIITDADISQHVVKILKIELIRI